MRRPHGNTSTSAAPENALTRPRGKAREGGQTSGGPLHSSPSPPIVTVEVLATWLGLSRQRVREWARDGLLGPFSRSGRRYLFRTDSVLAALQAREVEPARRPAPAPPLVVAPASSGILNLLRGRRDEEGEE